MSETPSTQQLNTAAPLIKIGHYTLGRTLGSKKLSSDNLRRNSNQNFFFLFRWNLRQGEDWRTHRHEAQGGDKDSQQAEDQEPRCGRQDSSRDPELEALPPSAHHQALPSHLNSHGHLHDYGICVGR